METRVGVNPSSPTQAKGQGRRQTRSPNCRKSYHRRISFRFIECRFGSASAEYVYRDSTITFEGEKSWTKKELILTSPLPGLFLLLLLTLFLSDESGSTVGLTDMYLRGTHRGGFLLCRVLPRPPNLSLLHSPLNLNLTLPIASPDGSAALLRLHNYPLLPSTLGRPTSADIDASFPVGTMLAILEPTVRRDITDGEWVVWVDAASDVVAVREGDAALEDVEWVGPDGKAWKQDEEVRKELDDWKDEGNKVRSRALC